MADTSGTRRERRAAARAERQERERAEAARARQRKRLFQLGGAVALAAAIIVVIVIATGGGDDGPKKKAGESVAGQTDAIALFRGIEQSGTTLGDPRAPVTLVEFADLQCPFCRDFTQQVLPTIVNDYVKTGRVRLEFRDVAFIGDDSTRAAQMAEAVGLQNRMFEFVDIFYANQGTENSGFVTDEFLREMAGAVPGVDVQRAMDDRGDPRVQRLMADATQEWQSNGFTGTPSFLAGRTGGTLEPLEVEALTVDAFTSRLDPIVERNAR